MANVLLDITNTKELEPDSDNDFLLYANSWEDVSDELRGLEVAFEQIESLSKIRGIVAKYRDRGLSRSSVKLANIATGSVRKTLKLNDIPKQVCMENLSEMDSVNVSLEGISDIIRRIWEAIKKTFEYIWNKITYIFRSQKRVINDQVAVSKKNEAEAKKVVDEIKTGKKEEPAKSFITDYLSLEALSHLDKEVNDGDLFNAMDQLNQNYKKIEGIIVELAIGADSITDDIVYLLHNLDEQKALDKLGDKLETFFDNTINKYIEATFQVPGIINTGDLAEAGMDISTLDLGSIRTIDGFINGGIVYFARNKTGNVGLFNIVPIKERTPNRPLSEIKYLDLDSLELFCAHVKSLVANAAVLEHVYETKVKAIKELVSKDMKACNDFIRNSTIVSREYGLSEQEFLVNFNFIKAAVSFLNKSTMDSVTMYNMYMNSIQFFNYFCKINLDHYKVSAK